MPNVPATEDEEITAIEDKAPVEKKGPDALPQASSSDNLVKELYYGTAEKTVQESAWVGKSLVKPYNSDDLYQKTGDYGIYEDMENDDQVSIAMQLKRDLVVGSGWTIVAENEDDQELADSLFVDLEEEPEVAFDDLLEEIIDVAYTKGFSLSEKIFKLKDDGSLALRNIKTRHPNSWLIHTDEHGNVERYEQVGTRGSQTMNIKPKSLIHYINNPKHQNPYGNSDLRKAYEAWFVKRHVVRFYSIFLEKAAGPIPVAKYDNNMPREKVTEVFNIIKNFQAKTAMVLPKGFEMEFLEATGNGEAYTKGIDLFNMFIGRSLVIPDLLGFQGSVTGGGSLSLGQSQIAVFYKHIQRRRRALERMVNKHIIQPLAVWNYGRMESYPKFVLNPISDDKALDYAKTYLELTKGKIYKPTLAEINHFKDLIKFPLSSEDDIEWLGAGSAGGGALGIPGQLGPDGLPLPAPESQVDENGEPIPGGAEPKEPGKEEPSKVPKAGEEEKPREAKFTDLGHFKAAVYSVTPGSFHERVDFSAAADDMDQGTALIKKEAKPIIDEIFESIFDQIAKKGILGDKPKPERIDTIKFMSLKKLQQMLKKNLRRAYVDQRSVARKEIFKRDFAQPLASDKFLEFLEYETFQYVGDWEFMIRKRVKQQLINAIKDGKPLSTVIGVLDAEGRELSDVSLERYARTKFTEVMNRARIEEFESSGVVGAYQYSAILDDRTTDVCATLHGKIFNVGDEPIPPLHFNCRSLLIPITKFEEFKPDTKVEVAGGEEMDIVKFIDQQTKDTGFSKR